MFGVSGGTRGPLVRVAMGGGGDKLEICVSWYGALFAIGGEGLRAIWWSTFGDADNGGDDAELLVHDGAGHGHGEFGDVGVV